MIHAMTIGLLLGNQYIPHGYCYLWQTPLVWLHVTSDAPIAIALTIALTTAMLQRFPADCIERLLLYARQGDDDALMKLLSDSPPDTSDTIPLLQRLIQVFGFGRVIRLADQALTRLNEVRSP